MLYHILNFLLKNNTNYNAHTLPDTDVTMTINTEIEHHGSSVKQQINEAGMLGRCAVSVTPCSH